jgi:thiol-disulfide isomerase/thioredoxin
MSALIIRLGVLVLVAICAWLVVLVGKRFVAERRQRALRGAPATMFTPDTATSRIRILSFSSEDCHQCKLQVPILQRIVEAHKGAVSITEIDAPTEPELTTRYQVLTVPTTVILDIEGRAHAINYGFANTQKLLEQIDALLVV